MDLLQLLDIDRERLPRGTEETIAYCEERWDVCGRPAEPRCLARFLDEALRSCAGKGLRYPKVLLLRLKQLQRAHWAARGTAGDSRS